MAFLTLLNLRLDEVKQRLSNEHYTDTVHHSKRWAKRWSGLTCSEITIELIITHRKERAKISNQTKNKDKDIIYLSSLFNWGIRKEYVSDNPASRVDTLRVENKDIYAPSEANIDNVLRQPPLTNETNCGALEIRLLAQERFIISFGMI